MIDPTAVTRFRDRQRQLLQDTYDQAWSDGVSNYSPPAPPPDRHDASHAIEAGLTGAALLAARRARPYAAPSVPDAERRGAALAAALSGLDHMTAALATLAPTVEHLDAATQAVADGVIGSHLEGAYAAGLAISDWADANAWRLDAGDSVAWAGEQAGYGEAADSAGQLLAWADSGDDAECADCQDLASLGPMPLEDFPTTPGAGDTECAAGCRCGWDAVDLLPGDEFAPLGPDGQDVIDRVASNASERINSLMPDLTGLD